jgi:dipeptidyl aminopeptidase/acylaminoacyl peptidase
MLAPVTTINLFADRVTPVAWHLGTIGYPHVLSVESETQTKRVSAMSNEQRVIVKEDLTRLRWLQGGKLSPDGSQAVYAVSHIGEEEEKEKEFVTLYLVDCARGAIRRLTDGKKRDSDPVWSPDGQTIAFVSDRYKKSQIVLLPVAGGEARQLTDLKQGASNPRWSPDGRLIAFTAGIDYGEDDPPDHSKEPYRVTRAVWRFDELGELDLAVNQLYVVDVDSGDVTKLTETPTVKGELHWSPSGTHLLFAARMDPESFRSFYPTYHTIDLEGNTRPVAPGWGYVEMGQWLADGNGVAFVAVPDDGAPIGTQNDLWVHDLNDGSFSNRTSSVPYAVGGGLEGRMPTAGLAAPFVGIAGDDAYVRVQAGGTVQIYSVALTGEEAATAVVAGARTCIPLDVAAGKLLYSVDDINATPDLYIANLDGSDERRLTHINDDFFAEVLHPAVHNLHFSGSDGAAVEGWFVAPTTPEATPPYPTILWIHGGPHGAQGHRFAFDTHMLTGAGYGVLFVNHRASTGYGNAFATGIKGDWGNLDYGDLMAGVDHAIAKGLADPERLGVCGISGGGNLTCWILGHTDRFRAAVPQNPVTNWVSFYGVSDVGVWFAVEELGGHPHEIPDVYRRCSPLTYAHHCVTPTLIIQSEHDWRCPPEQSEQFYTVLKANGCVVEMLRQPGGAHGGAIGGPIPLRKANLAAKLDWFNRYVLGRGPDS